MSNELMKVFTYQENEVRTIIKDGEPWFVAKDVCDILDISNHRDAATRLDDDEKDAVGIPDAMGRSQLTSIVLERNQMERRLGGTSLCVNSG